MGNQETEVRCDLCFAERCPVKEYVYISDEPFKKTLKTDKKADNYLPQPIESPWQGLSRVFEY